MRTAFNSVLITTILISLIWVPPQAWGAASHAQDALKTDWDFVNKALFYDGRVPRIRIFTRWRRTVVIGITPFNLRDEENVAKIARSLSKFLFPAGLVFATRKKGRRGNVTIEVKARDKAPKRVCEEINCQTADGYTLYSIDDYLWLKWADIWLADDLQGLKRYAAIFREIVYSIAVINRSKLIKKSLFIDENDIRKNQSILTKRGKKLLYFIYAHLKPGDKEAEVRRAFNLHWTNIKIPETR